MPCSTLDLSKKNTLLIDKFKEYANLTGIPLDDVLYECLSEYLEITIETAIECLSERAATA